MVQLLLKVGYRKQTIIDDFKLYKYCAYIIFSIMLFLCTGLIYIVCSLQNPFEKTVLINFICMFFSLYNMPSVVDEIKMPKSVSLLQMKNNLLYWAFNFLKKNILVVPLSVGLFTNLVYSAIFNLENFIIIIATLLAQTLIVFMSVVSNKIKILFISSIGALLLSVYFEKKLMIMLIIFLQIIAFIHFFPYIIRGKYFQSDYNNALGSRYTNNFVTYIIKYLLRIKKKEYLELIFTSVISCIIYYISHNIKFVSLYFVLFFMAKIQLQIESQQSDYRRLYAKNIFLNVLQVNSFKKILYSLEFKTFVLDSISLLIFTVFVTFFGGEFLYILLSFINTILLLFLYINKIMRIFYIKLYNRIYFKGTFVNIIMFYLIFLILNVDFVIKNNIHFGISVIMALILNILPIEKALSLNLFKRKNQVYMDNLN